VDEKSRWLTVVYQPYWLLVAVNDDEKYGVAVVRMRERQNRPWFVFFGCEIFLESRRNLFHFFPYK
jgi:hypothetical protein